MPYYYKVREYNDFESRDLWEYELQLSPEDIVMLNFHIWELGRAWSNYYFLNGNCSYWAIRVLEAIRPDLDFEKKFASKFVIPSETLKSLFKYKGFVKNISYRPSLRKQLLLQMQDLDKIDLKKTISLVEKLFNQNAKKENIKQLKPQIIDTALLLYDYKGAPDFLSNEKELLKKKQVLLVARSEMPTTLKKHKFEVPKLKPHHTHPPRRFGLGSTYFNDSEFQSFHFNYKQGFHEIMDSHVGFNPHMGLNYLDISFSAVETINNDYKFRLAHLHLIKIEAFTPLSLLDSNYSWRLNFGIDSELKYFDPLTQVGFAQFESGFSKSYLNDQVLFYFLISNNIEFYSDFKNKIRFGISPLTGVKLNFSPNDILIFEAKPFWFYDFNENPSYITQLQLRYQSYFKQLNTAAYLKADAFYSTEADNFRLAAGLNYYF